MRATDRFLLALCQTVSAALFLGINWNSGQPAHAWFAVLMLITGVVLVWDALAKHVRARQANEWGG